MDLPTGTEKAPSRDKIEKTFITARSFDAQVSLPVYARVVKHMSACRNADTQLFLDAP